MKRENLEKMSVVEIRMKSAAAGKTRFFDPPHMIFRIAAAGFHAN